MSKRSNYNTREGTIHLISTILVVEDDEALLRLIQKNLQRAGFHTESSSNGAEAISRIIDRPPDLLLLDYRLPDMTGKQVIEALTKRGCSVPFIVITGHGDEKVAVEMMKLGARDYLVKDVAFLDLLPSVAKQAFKQLALERQLADFFQMQQVFMNIVVNAEQAMLGAHGREKLVVKTKKAGGIIQIIFIDDGPGISEENLKRIFDPFFTTKGVGKDTGLGLSICYGLIEGHCGRIYATSKLGKGATFIVEIPILYEEKNRDAIGGKL